MEDNKNEKLVKVIKILVIVCIALVIVGVSALLTNVIMSNSPNSSDVITQESSQTSKRGTYLEYSGEQSKVEESSTVNSVVSDSSIENSIVENSVGVESSSNSESDSNRKLLSDVEDFTDFPENEAEAYGIRGVWENQDIYMKTYYRMGYIRGHIVRSNNNSTESIIEGSLKEVLYGLKSDFSPYKDKLLGATYTADAEGHIATINILFSDGEEFYFKVGDSGIDSVLKYSEFTNDEVEFYKHFRLNRRSESEGNYIISFG